MPREARLSQAAPAIHVVAGILVDAERRVLIAQRPPGKHMAGGWEFPGGKLDGDEDRFDGLRRELAEELGIDVTDATPLATCDHAYPDRRVHLDVWRIQSYSGPVRPNEHQPLRWVPVAALPEAGLLPADQPIVAALQRALSNTADSLPGMGGDAGSDRK